MKVVHVISGLGDGGAEGMLVRLCEASGEVQHIVIALTTDVSKSIALKEIGVKVFVFNLKSKLNVITQLQNIVSLIRLHEPNVIQTWMYAGDLVGSLVGAILNIPVVWNVRHSTFSINRKNFKNIILRFFLAFISWLSPKSVVFCSKSAMKIHSKIGYCHDKFVFIPNGYSNSFGLKFFDDVPKCSNDNLPRFGMLARYNEQKDHITLLEACALCRDRGFDFQLHIGGKDIDNDNCELAAIIDNNNLSNHVFLHGFVDDIEQFWCEIDIGMLSSKSGEAFPNVIAEAMLCGVPCIVTDVGESASIVCDTGWVVPPSSKLALSEAMCDAIRERKTADWRTRCKDARQRIEGSYSIGQSVLAFKNLWDQVAK